MTSHFQLTVGQSNKRFTWLCSKNIWRKNVFGTGMLGACLLWALFTAMASAHAEQYTVTSIQAINSLTLNNGQKIQLLGVDRLEDEDLNAKGLLFLEGLLKAKKITVEFAAQDSALRPSDAYVWYEIFPDSEKFEELDLPRFYWTQKRPTSDGKSKTFVLLNATIIKAGYARAVVIESHPEFSKLFEDLYQETQMENLNLCHEK